jgi:hypothetical protein
LIVSLTILSWAIVHAKIAATAAIITKIEAGAASATDLSGQLAAFSESSQGLVSYSRVIGAIALSSTLLISIGFWVYKLRRQSNASNVVAEAFALGKLEASLTMLEAAAKARDIEGMQKALLMIKRVSNFKRWTQNSTA